MLTRRVFALPPKGTMGTVIYLNHGRARVRWPGGKVSEIPAHWLRMPNALELLAMQVDAPDPQTSRARRKERRRENNRSS